MAGAWEKAFIYAVCSIRTLQKIECSWVVLRCVACDLKGFLEKQVMWPYYKIPVVTFAYNFEHQLVVGLLNNQHKCAQVAVALRGWNIEFLQGTALSAASGWPHEAAIPDAVYSVFSSLPILILAFKYLLLRVLHVSDQIWFFFQILGMGSKRLLTLTHRAQVKRFTQDLLKLLKSQASKQVIVREFLQAYHW